jgi:hypothetical protein
MMEHYRNNNILEEPKTFKKPLPIFKKYKSIDSKILPLPKIKRLTLLVNH